MKLLQILLILIIIPQNKDFLSGQLRYSRVRTAKAVTDSILKNKFESKSIKYPPDNIFIRVFKSEALLEVWALNYETEQFVLVSDYDICSLSGDIGPKRRRGDLQIPEGIYYISHFNPVSNFYLSLKINYPNKSDRLLGYKQDLGGDIFIHGDCVTIGCIPITDQYIKELYWIAVQAKTNGQKKIPVHIFPAKLSDLQWNMMKDKYKSELLKFWENLKLIYEYFEEFKHIPIVKVDDHGKYIIENDG